MTAITDAFFSLWAGGPAWAPLIVVSALAGLVAAIVFRFTSRQDLLRRDAELIQAQLLAMKLFRDDLGTMGRCLGRLLRFTALRLWHSLPPTLVMMVPFVLLLTQLARWYEHAPLLPGDQALVMLQLSKDEWSESNTLALEQSAEFVVETPSLRDPGEHALYWRIGITQPRKASLRWKLPQQEIQKNITIASNRQQLLAIDARRPGPGWTDRLLHPGGAAFGPTDTIRGIDVQYPRRSTPLLGLDLPWWATFLILSVLAAILGGRIMRVQF
ncbi:MAG: hypothetical protein IT425_14215 [Pirellulales bacterium]|nr:hypothetical protein [Pirellulales bacterium]